jgi:hypothetical protein
MTLRITRLRWPDYYVPRLILQLDRAVLLPRAGVNAPNSKCLAAVYTHAPKAHV